MIIVAFLLIKCKEAFCRVPYAVLSQRLSILYLNTCVGLGYGNYRIIFQTVTIVSSCLRHTHQLIAINY